MSTIKADGIQASTGTNTDLTLAGKGTGVPDLAAGFKVGGTVEKLTGVAPSTSGNVLTSDGTNWTSAAAAGGGSGAWTQIGTGVASSSSTLTVTGINSSTYDTHAFIFTNFLPSASGQSLYMRLGTSGGIITASNYQWHCSELSTGGTGYSGQKGENVTGAKIAIEPSNSSSRGGAGGTIFLTNNDGTNHPAWYGIHAASKVTYTSGGSVLGVLNSASNIDRVQLYFQSGNITSGRLTVYGVSHA